MKKIVWIAAGTLAFAVLAGCVSLPEQRLKDIGRIRRVHNGMTEQELRLLMGEDVMSIQGTEGNIRRVVTNPYTTETVAAGTRVLEVVTYFTNPKPKDGPITDDELTPFVLENGRVIGQGWDFLKKTTQAP